MVAERDPVVKYGRFTGESKYSAKIQPRPACTRKNLSRFLYQTTSLFSLPKTPTFVPSRTFSNGRRLVVDG